MSSRRYGVSTGLPELPTSGTEEQRALLGPLYRGITDLAKQVSDLTGVTQLDSSSIQGLNPTQEHDKFRTRTLIFQCLEPLQYGRLVYLVRYGDNAGVQYANSKNDVNLPAIGVCVEPGGTTQIGDYCRVQLFEGLVTGLTGLWPGKIYYLGENGQYLDAPPPSGTYHTQPVAVAISTTSMLVNIKLQPRTW